MEAIFTVTDLLTIIGALTAIVTVWVALNNRVAKVETKVENMPSAESIATDITQLKSDVNNLKEGLGTIFNKLDAQQEILTDIRIRISQDNGK